MAKVLKTESVLFSSYALMHKLTSLSTRKRSPAKNDLTTLKVLKDNAEELGIEVEELVDGAYEFRQGNVTRRIRGGPLIDLDNAFTYWLCGNKFATYEVLKKYGFRKVPHYERYSLGTIKEARQDFLKRNKAVVIKPNFGTSRGKGVTVDIRNMKELNKAIYNSLIYDGDYLMEDFIEGDHFRILFFKDSMLDAFQRIPANVKGDGTNNIRNLIRNENDRRTKEKGPLYPILIDNDVKRCLAKKNMSFNYIPRKDEMVCVRTAINYRAGGEMRNVKSIVNEDIIRDGQRIMKILDITLGGIDVITKNIEKPLAETGGAINEVNTSPGLFVHNKDVIRNVLNLMFEGN